MSDNKSNREFVNINTSADVGMPGKVKQKQDDKEETGLPVKIPLSILRWLAYSLLFIIFLMPALWYYNIWFTISPSLILGHFASQLNALIKK